MVRNYSLIISLFFWVALSGCGIGDWTATDPIQAEPGEIVDKAVEVLRRHDFYIEHFDREEGEVETGWNFRPTIHSHTGMRRRIEIRLEKAEGESALQGKEYWIARFRCSHERNENVVNPMNYYEADWRSLGRDLEYEEFLSGMVFMALKDSTEYGISPELENSLDSQGTTRERKELEEEISKYEKEIRELENRQKELESKSHKETPPNSESEDQD
ncbi:MAG: hypothetical protein QF752_11780 [Planctomycetota bacterium]|jgi:hypothetical protein|nr:hypothetical protein [Planctomycetota bacterium]